MEAESPTNEAWQTPTPHLGKRIARVLVVDLLILAVLIATGEVGVRRFLPEYSQFVFTETLTGGHPRTRNSFGMRDREFPVARPADETRLLCLGNSTTRGAGVAVEHSYPKQLETLLDQRGTIGIHLVINAGGEGRSLIRALEFLKEDGLAFEPAVVVLGFSPSMLGILKREQASLKASQSGTEQVRSASVSTKMALPDRLLQRVRVTLYGSYLYAFLNGNLRRALYRIGILRDRMDAGSAISAYAFDVPGVDLNDIEGAYRLLDTSLTDMKALLDERDIPFVVLGIPSRFRISDDRVDNQHGFELEKIRIEPLDRVAAYCEDLGVPFVDLRLQLRRERRRMLDGGRPWDDLYVPLDYAHLNSVGLHIAAEELLRIIDVHEWLTDANRRADRWTPHRGVVGSLTSRRASPENSADDSD